MTHRWHIILLTSALTVTAFAEPSDWSAWSRVAKWNGYASVVTEHLTQRDNGVSRENSLELAVTHLRFTLERPPRQHPIQLEWPMTRGQVEYQWTFRKHWSNINGDYEKVASQAHYAGGPRESHETSFTLFTDTGRWDFTTPGFAAAEYKITDVIENRRHSEHEAYTMVHTWDPIENGVFRGVAPKRIGPIAHSQVLDLSHPEHNGKVTAAKTLTLHLWPEFDDVEVEVTIEDYADWLPRGSLVGTASAGNSLVARAVLKSKPPATKLPVRAKLFRFELTDVTREPGVAMNWPLEAADNSPDLQLAGDFGARLSNANLTAEADPKPNADDRDEVRVRIAAHDFGAAGQLRVICALTDGREVGGYLMHDGRRLAPIPLPYRRDSSRIAEKWHREWKVAGSDAADDDAAPAGNGATGDGFSHYEEYRGFVVGGLHNRTNPARKDFFVHNAIGRKAIAGLAHFATITKLTTHFELRRNELPESRRMNHNRSAKSPRSTAEFQHAVVLDDKAEGEASETVSTGAVARPKTTQRVSVHPVLFMPGRKPHEAESAIAHELLHSIGVKEHGDADRDVVWIRHEGGEHPGVWLEERPAGWSESKGRMVYSDNPGARIRLINSAGLEVPPEGLAMFEEPVILYLGEHQGKHSGVVDCVIRYDCAKAFRVPERARDRFLKEIEPVGMGLCASATGTEFNAPGLPLVRYGNAQRGNCQQHFCVRDDAPDP